MRFKIVASAAGMIISLFSVSLLLPFITGLIYEESFLDIVLAYIIPGLFSLALGIFLMAYGKRAGKIGGDLRPVEALFTVAVVWIIIALIGSFPYMIINALPNFFDALFESMSGFTTTGSSVITVIDPLPKSILLWRSLTQWIGGLGVIVLMVAIFSILLGGPKAGMLLMKGEVPGHSSEKLAPRIKDTAKTMWGVYGILTIAEILILSLLGLSLYDAVCHTFTTLATGGFGTHTESIAYYKDFPTAPLIEAVFVIFMLMGSINFVLHYKFFRRYKSSYLKDTEFKVYISIVVVLWCIVALDLALNNIYSPGESMRASIFNVTSIISTTGYATEDFGQWPALSQFIMVVAMMMGGMTGSTSGAIKTARLIIAYKTLGRSLKRIGHPQSILPLSVGNLLIKDRIVNGVSVFIFGYLAMFLIATFLMTLTGLDIVSSFSSVATTMGGVGPGLNVVGPASNFASLNVPGKFILTLLMWFGRLELITALVLFLPSTYRS